MEFSSKAVQRAHDASLTAVYSAIADPTRREMMELLGTRELSITAIASHFPMSRVAISKHLAVLEQAGLVKDRKVGANIAINSTRFHCVRPMHG